ncbi:hypothetical protein LCGC14_1916520, partial [marine sediment metagenome]
MPTRFTERTSARGRPVLVRSYAAVQQEAPKASARPRPDRYDRFANRYQAQLVAKYEEWSRETQRLVNGAIRQGASAAQAQAIVDARLQDLLVELRVLGRQRIQQAASLGLGRQLARWETSPAVLNSVAQLQGRNDDFLADSLIPALVAALAVTDPAARTQAVNTSLLAGRTNVAPFSGGAVVATFEVQREAGRQENLDREARGEGPIPVKWNLDSLAAHCSDDPARGTFGCPTLEGVYAGGWSQLKTVPAGLTSCLGSCVLPGNVVIAEAELGFRSAYNGPALELIVAGGRRLTVTPNHPILTAQGFVAAQFLHEGDYVVCGPVGQEVATPVHEHNHNVPTRIEEVWNALSVVAGERGSSISHGAAALDFNGDGRFVKGNVDVVAPDGLLLRKADAPLPKHISQQEFHWSSLGDMLLARLRTFEQFLSPPDAASYFVVGGRSPEEALGGRSSLHSGVHGLAAVAERHASLDEPSPEGSPRHARLGGQSLERLPGPVTTEQIIEIRQFDYLGHVYDLQTVSGLYSASGV